MKSYFEVEIENQILKGKALLQETNRSIKKLENSIRDYHIWDNENVDLLLKYDIEANKIQQYKNLFDNDKELTCEEFIERKSNFKKLINSKIIYISRLGLINPNDVKSSLNLKRLFAYMVAFLSFVGLVLGIVNDGLGKSVKELLSTEANYDNVISKKIDIFGKSNRDFKIIVLPFSPDRNCEYLKTDYEQIVVNRIVDKAYKEKLSIDVMYLDYIECPISVENVLKIGNSTNSDLILWGEYDENCTDATKLRIRYAFLNGNEWVSEKVEDSGKKEIADLEMLRSGYLQREVDEIVYYTLALYALKKGDWEKVIEYVKYTDVNSNHEGDITKEAIYAIYLHIWKTKSFRARGQPSIIDVMSKDEKIALSYFWLKDYRTSLQHYLKLRNKERWDVELQIAINYFNLKRYEKALEVIEENNLEKGNRVVSSKIFHKAGKSEIALNLLEREMNDVQIGYPELQLLALKYNILKDIGDSDAMALVNMQLLMLDDYDDEYVNNYDWTIKYFMMRTS